MQEKAQLVPEALPGDGLTGCTCRYGYHGMGRPCAGVDHDLTPFRSLFWSLPNS